MPKKTFYLSEEDLSTYEKAKSIAGDSISSVLMQGLKDFVVKWEKQEFGYTEFMLFEGRESYTDQIPQGQHFKFIGKLLSQATKEYTPEISDTYSLYITRKGKFLLYIDSEDLTKDEHVCKKEIKDNISELKDRKPKLPPELFTEADKKMPNLFIEVLDI